MRPKNFTILIADDHEIVREGIRTLIGRSGRGWDVCGEASDGEEAILIGVSRPTLRAIREQKQYLHVVNH